MRVAVVTGASSGIGAELVPRRCAARGWRVVGLSRRAAADADEHETCDVGDREAVEAVAARVLERHPRIDLLVNDAGHRRRGAGFLDAEPELDRGARRDELPRLGVDAARVPAGPRARLVRVVNVVSVAGTVADGPYSASKHAQLCFSRALAVELGRRGDLGARP